jgi:type IV secretion system protein VirD4
MNALVPQGGGLRRGIELGFFNGRPLVYDGTEPVAIDAQAGKGKLTRFLGVNLVSPRTANLSKIITDPKDAELAWVSWKTLERQGYRVRFINPGKLYGYPGETFNFNTRLLEVAARPALHGIVGEAAYDAASYLVPIDPDVRNRWIGQGVRTAFATYNKITALYPSSRWACTPGGLWDFFGRGREEIEEDLSVWASDSRMLACFVSLRALRPHAISGTPTLPSSSNGCKASSRVLRPAPQPIGTRSILPI